MREYKDKKKMSRYGKKIEKIARKKIKRDVHESVKCVCGED